MAGKIKFADEWGRSQARGRYGKPSGSLAAPDTHAPQAPEDKHGANYDNDTPNNWLRGGGESAEGKPGFDHGRKRK